MRKREKEFNRLQDKVTALLRDKNRDLKSGWELINSLKAAQMASEELPVRACLSFMAFIYLYRYRSISYSLNKWNKLEKQTNHKTKKTTRKTSLFFSLVTW